jgi:DNA modification methylase
VKLLREINEKIAFWICEDQSWIKEEIMSLNTRKERNRKSELMKWIEKRNEVLYISKDEKVLRDIDNLIELAFLIEAITSRKLTQICKKRETNA